MAGTRDVTRLDKYIFSQTVPPFIVATMSITALVWFTQILQRVDLMVKDGSSLTAFTNIALLLIPSVVTVISPFALFGVVLHLLNRLQTDSEVAVMFAAGASRMRIARPLLFLTLLSAGFTACMTVKYSPASKSAVERVVQEIRTDLAKSVINSRKFSFPANGLMIYAEDVKPGNQYSGVLILDQRKPDEPVTYLAENGLYHASDFGPRLHLVRGTIERVDPDTGDVVIARFDETAIDLTPYRQDAHPSPLKPSSRYVSDLLNPGATLPFDIINRGKLIAEGHFRLTAPLYNFLYVCIALAALLCGRINRGGYGMRIAAAIIMAVLFRVLGVVAQNTAQQDPALNILQYGIPIVGTVIALVWLVGQPRPGLRKKRLSVARQAALDFPREAT